MGWAQKQFEFTANSDTTILVFDSLTPGGFGPALDNVQVIPIPEPRMAVVMGAFALAIHRRRVP
jgi:hypothetical protein